MLIPEEIIVESWREKTASSAGLTRFRKDSSISREVCLSVTSRTISPRDFSWSATACLDSASTSPPALVPARSTALKTYVLILQALCSRERRGAEQPPELLRRRRAGFGELAGDLALAHERGQRGIHRLHARRRAGLQHRVDLVCLALADQVAHGRIGHEHLAGHHAAGAVRGGKQLLGHDPLQRDRQLHPNLALLVGRE